MAAAPAESCQSLPKRSPWGRLGSVLYTCKRLPRRRRRFNHFWSISLSSAAHKTMNYLGMTFAASIHALASLAAIACGAIGALNDAVGQWCGADGARREQHDANQANGLGENPFFFSLPHPSPDARTRHAQTPSTRESPTEYLHKTHRTLTHTSTPDSRDTPAAPQHRA